MEQIVVQAVVAIGLLFGGGVIVKLYTEYRARNRSDNDAVVEHYRQIVVDIRREHADEIARIRREHAEDVSRIWASVRRMRGEYLEEKTGGSTDTETGIKAVDNG